MEILENNFNVTFTNSAAAVKAKQIADKCIRAVPLDMRRKAYDPISDAADTLYIEDDVNLTINECYFDCHELIQVSKPVVKGIANSMPDEDFVFIIGGLDECDECVIEGSYHNGVLDLTTALYPMGYSEYLLCRGCLEEIVRTEDYDPKKVYVCPKCGEEFNSSENGPVIEKETINIC